MGPGKYNVSATIPLSHHTKQPVYTFAQAERKLLEQEQHINTYNSEDEIHENMVKMKHILGQQSSDDSHAEKQTSQEDESDAIDQHIQTLSVKERRTQAYERAQQAAERRKQEVQNKIQAKQLSLQKRK